MNARVAKELLAIAEELEELEVIVAKEQEGLRTEVALRLLAGMEERDYVTREELEAICPSCAKKMAKKGFARIKKSALKMANVKMSECVAEVGQNSGIENPEQLCAWLRFYGQQD
jgi:hypothetical protein